MSILDTGPKQSSSSGYGLTVDQAKVMKQLAATYQPLIGQGQNVYGGDWVAQPSSLQTGAYQAGQNFLDYFGGNSTMPLFQETGTALSKILGGEGGATPIDYGTANSLFNTMYAEPAKEQFSRFTVPTVQEQFAGPGYWSSARANAVTQAGSELASQLNQMRGEFDWNVLQNNQALQEAAANRMQQGVSQGISYGLAPSQAALSNLQGLQGVAGLGAQQQAQQQAEIDAQMQKFAMENQITDPQVLEVLYNLIQKPVSSSSSTSYYSPTEWWKMIGAMAGGTASAMSLL